MKRVLFIKAIRRVETHKPSETESMRLVAKKMYREIRKIQCVTARLYEAEAEESPSLMGSALLCEGFIQRGGKQLRVVYRATCIIFIGWNLHFDLSFIE